MRKKERKPPQLSPEQIERLEEGFRLGMSREEVLDYAGVETGDFEAVCEADPELAARLKQLKGYAAVMARRAILRAIEEGNESLSKWYLDRLDEEAERQAALERRRVQSGERGEEGGAQVIKVEFAIPRPQAEPAPGSRLKSCRAEDPARLGRGEG